MFRKNYKFAETEDKRYLIELKGVIRFNIINETNSDKQYRECNVSYENFYEDLSDKKENLKFSDLELIFKDLKTYSKRGFYNKLERIRKQV